MIFGLIIMDAERKIYLLSQRAIGVWRLEEATILTRTEDCYLLQVRVHQEANPEMRLGIRARGETTRLTTSM
jgi:hypothetical protein